ncbi:MAG: efflux transporter outer membrane subunit [Desulfobacteraceae bacterium]|nr:efflux transporter outer membrane subunit [Desulfobacteraceae bacterium]
MNPTHCGVNFSWPDFLKGIVQKFFILAAIALCGCPAVGPDYVKPEVEQPKAWHSKLDNGLSATAMSTEALARWWTTLNDPVLSELMTRAMSGNLDLQGAQARVREARARRGISQAGYYPAVDASGNYATNRSSESTVPTAQGKEYQMYNVGVDAAWEIDLFGGVRRSVEAADADLAATQEDLNNVLVSLLAEAALTYVDVRTLQKRVEVAEANVKAQQETYLLTQSRFKAGLTDELAVQGASYALAGTRAQIPALQARLVASMNSLDVLLGLTPGTVHAQLSAKAPIPVPPASVAVGVPAETLRNRPDVRRAERQLAAQTALIGVAKADLYPKLSLVGTIGYEAQNLQNIGNASNNLLDSGNLTYRYGPSVSWAIFRGGAVFQNIEVQNARQEQALKFYKSTVLSALGEAESALAAYAREQERRDQLVTATQAASMAFKLARNQYQAGLVDFSVVLIAQQSMLNYEDQLALSEGAVTTNLVKLYKSLGGGWTAQTNLSQGGPQHGNNPKQKK